MSRDLIFTLPGTVLFGLLLGLIGRHVPLLGGGHALPFALTATLFSLLPTVVIQRFRQQIQSGPANRQTVMLLAATGARMGIVLLAALVLALVWPLFQEPGFWIDVLLLYLFGLVIEVRLLLRSLPRSTTPPLVSGLDR